MGYTTFGKRYRMIGTMDAIDSGPGSGRLELLTDAGVVLASIALKDPSGTVVDDLLTFSVPCVGLASAKGVPTKARLTNSEGQIVREDLTVGTENAQVIIDVAVITLVGQTVTLKAGTIRHAP